MIEVNWRQMSRDVADMAKAYQNLPGYLGKRHMVASMRRAIKEAGGVQKLRANTPPVGTRRGRRKKGEKPRSTGSLRRAVATKGRWIGSYKSGAAVAGLGYKFGAESRKAIWHEFGTTRMKGIAMMQRTFHSIRGLVASKLTKEMAIGLENAARDANPGMSARGRAAGL